MSMLSRPATFAFPVGVALIAASLALAFAAPGAGAQPSPAPTGHGKTAGAVPGDNGTVKIHNSTTPVTDPRDELHVCVFYLDAFGFDPSQSVSWQIESWPPTGDRAVVDQGTLTLDSSGDGNTSDQTLPNGHYKLFWTFVGEHGAAKQKVFWVSCPTSTPTPTPSSTPTSTPSSTPTSTPSSTPTSTPSSTLTQSPSPIASQTSSQSPTPAPSSSVAPATGASPVSGTLPVTG